MLVCNLPQFYSYLQSIYTQAVEWIATVAELSTILDSFFTGYTYHKHSYRSGGWKVVGSHEVAG